METALKISAPSLFVATILFFGSASATIYTKRLPQEMRDIVTSIQCIHNFSSTEELDIKYKAIKSIEITLAEQLRSVKDYSMLAKTLRISVQANKKYRSEGIFVNCWNFILDDHGLSKKELRYYLENGEIR